MGTFQFGACCVVEIVQSESARAIACEIERESVKRLAHSTSLEAGGVDTGLIEVHWS
jgi:hypothetical protein